MQRRFGGSVVLLDFVSRISPNPSQRNWSAITSSRQNGRPRSADLQGIEAVESLGESKTEGALRDMQRSHEKYTRIHAQQATQFCHQSNCHVIYLSFYFRFDELVAGVVPPRRLYFLGSKKQLIIDPIQGPNEKSLPFRLMSTLFLVPLPPSQNPLPALPTSVARHIAQSSGRYTCSREQKPLNRQHLLVNNVQISCRLTRSCGWRVRWDDLYLHHGIWCSQYLFCESMGPSR